MAMRYSSQCPSWMHICRNSPESRFQCIIDMSMNVVDSGHIEFMEG
jgi:hypothetical protein